MHYSVLSFPMSAVGSLGCDLCEGWGFFLFKNLEYAPVITERKSFSLERLNKFKSEYLFKLLF